MNLDAEQKSFLRELLLREKALLGSGHGVTYFGMHKTLVERKRAVIERTLSQLEVD